MNLKRISPIDERVEPLMRAAYDKYTAMVLAPLLNFEYKETLYRKMAKAIFCFFTLCASSLLLANSSHL